MRGRKGKKHEHVNHERWLVSYADFITLLFAFFVVMFAVSQVDSKKLGRFVESVSYAFQLKGVFQENQGSSLQSGGSAGNSVVPLVVAERPTFLPHRASSRQAQEVLHELEAKLETAGLMDAVTLRHDPRGVAIALPEKGFFYAGTATLRPEAVDKLRAVARVLSAEEGAVQIEAHTESLQSTTARFSSNWELSGAQAARLASFLEKEAGLAPQRLSATGLAQYHPLVEDVGRSNPDWNSRIDLVLITSEEGN